MSLLLDTNTVSDYFRRHPRVAAAMTAHAPYQLAVSAVTAHEVHFGLFRQPSAATTLASKVRSFFSVVRVIPFDAAAALRSAEVLARLDRAGRKISEMDALIAGTALAEGLTLVTSNTREFSRVRGLEIVDWREA
jgi:tRNA(fMet)-specific endonuclease VapC